MSVWRFSEHAASSRLVAVGSVFALALLMGTMVSLDRRASATAASSSYDKTKLADHLERQVSGARALRHLRVWQAMTDASGGNRASGTVAVRASADYLVRRLEKAGYRVVRQPVPYADYLVDAERIELPGSRMRTMALKWSPTTSEAGLDAPLLVIPAEGDATPGCESTDFANKPVAGSIVLAPMVGCSFLQQEKAAADVGAAAYVGYKLTPRPDNRYRFLIPGSHQARIPMTTVTETDAKRLARFAGQRIRLVVRGHRVTGVTENVLAETSGGDPARVVMAGAHLDSVPEGPGINDNATSAAALLETALRLAPLQARVAHRVRFAWWGAEELLSVGSSYYVGQLTPADRDRLELYLNWELIGSPNFARFILDGDDSDHSDTGGGPAPPGSGEIERVFVEHYRDRGLAIETEDVTAIGSDHFPFMFSGIPVGGLDGGAYHTKTVEQAGRYGGVAGDMYDRCYHQPCDRIANLHLAEFDRNTRAVAWIVGHFASHGLPDRR